MTETLEPGTATLGTATLGTKAGTDRPRLGEQAGPPEAERTGDAAPASAAPSGIVVGTDADGGAGAADGTVPDDVVRAIALGWATNTLYGVCARKPVEPDDAGHLPNDAELTPAEAARRYMRRVDVGVRQLLARLSPEVAAETALLQAALQRRNPTGPTCPARLKLRDLHVHLLSSLAASDPRVGKAYALGSALARIADELGTRSLRAATASNRSSAARPMRTAKVSRRYATVAGQRDELVRVHDQVRDLATVLPPHVGQPVRESIARWITYMDGERRTRRTGSERDELLVLQRQVFLWKALLVREKDAEDSLSADEVLAVTLAALRRLKSYALLALRALTGLLPLVILVAGGAVVAAALALAHTGTASTALVTTVGGVVATSWRAGRANVVELVGELKGRIQGSLEDAAIAQAITLLPADARRRRVRKDAAVQVLVPARSGSAASADPL